MVRRKVFTAHESNPQENIHITYINIINIVLLINVIASKNIKGERGAHVAWPMGKLGCRDGLGCCREEGGDPAVVVAADLVKGLGVGRLGLVEILRPGGGALLAWSREVKPGPCCRLEAVDGCAAVQGAAGSATGLQPMGEAACQQGGAGCIALPWPELHGGEDRMVDGDGIMVG